MAVLSILTLALAISSGVTAKPFGHKKGTEAFKTPDFSGFPTNLPTELGTPPAGWRSHFTPGPGFGGPHTPGGDFGDFPTALPTETPTGFIKRHEKFEHHTPGGFGGHHTPGAGGFGGHHTPGAGGHEHHTPGGDFGDFTALPTATPTGFDKRDKHFGHHTPGAGGHGDHTGFPGGQTPTPGEFGAAKFTGTPTGDFKGERPTGTPPAGTPCPGGPGGFGGKFPGGDYTPGAFPTSFLTKARPSS